jgi:WD40 repeat protein
VATGQIGRDPTIHIWDTGTMRCLSNIPGFHQRGICLLAFSEDGSRLASVGLDDDHSVAIHEWYGSRPIGMAPAPPG